MKKPLRILVVEDSEIAAKITRISLSNFHCEIEVAQSGAEALNQLQQPYDLILMDVGLPDMTGIEIAQRIRNTKGLSQHALIIALTGHTNYEYREKCKNAGMNDFLEKPLTIAKCRDMLEKHELI